jgi:hypothetical protein
MSTIRCLVTALLAFGWWTGSAGAQEPPPPFDEPVEVHLGRPPPPRDGGPQGGHPRPPHDGFTDDRPHRRGGGPEGGRGQDMRRGSRPDQAQGRPLDRLLRHMQEQNPEEFAEMQRLRKENPDEFNRRLRARRDTIRRERVMDGLSEMPRLREFMQSLTPEQREEVARRFSEATHRGAKRMKEMSDPRVRELELSVSRQARAYREAPAEEQPNLRNEMHNTIAELFDAREAQRAGQVQEAEQRLEQLRHALETRAAKREQIIERRVNELTDGDLLKW